MISQDKIDCYTAIYPYGSRIYGTAQPNSDWDYIGLSDSDGEITQGEINIKVMTPEHFQYLLDVHHISALECYFLDATLVTKHYPQSWKFKLDLVKLRNSISFKSDHAWTKAKKKLIAPYQDVQDEFYRGKKSLFHSFRIADFGIQIAKYGKIIDYSSCNNIFYDIMTDPELNWEHYYSKWKLEHNKLLTEFRKFAPKG